MGNLSKKVIVLTAVMTMFLFVSKPLASTFTDIGDSYWAEEEIEYLVNKKIVNGYNDGRFGINDSIKRIHAAMILVRALNLDTSGRPNPNFKDIKPGDSGYEIAATVADEGIFSGSNGYFNPGKPLTRAEMAKVLAEAYNLSYVFEADFSDIPSSYWGQPYISALVGNYVTNGYPDNTYRPGDKLTRAQFAAFMARILDDQFKIGIFYQSGNSAAEWGTDDSLTLTLPIYSSYEKTVTNLKSKVSIVVNEEVIAEAFFDFGSQFSLNPGEEKMITLKFKPDYVYYPADLSDGFDIYSLTTVNH